MRCEASGNGTLKIHCSIIASRVSPEAWSVKTRRLWEKLLRNCDAPEEKMISSSCFIKWLRVHSKFARVRIGNEISYAVNENFCVSNSIPASSWEIISCRGTWLPPLGLNGVHFKPEPARLDSRHRSVMAEER